MEATEESSWVGASHQSADRDSGRGFADKTINKFAETRWASQMLRRGVKQQVCPDLIDIVEKMTIVLDKPE